MKIINWNVRGLGNPRMRQALEKILHLHKAQLLFLCETKLTTGQVKNVCRRLMFDNYFAVDRIGKSGGLAIMWSSEITLQITSYSRYHIDMQVQKANGKFWKCTGVYRHPKASERKHT
ncbi:hypothetical protein AB3S75_033997 [Citrus x aurantiifolia]